MIKQFKLYRGTKSSIKIGGNRIFLEQKIVYNVNNHYFQYFINDYVQHRYNTSNMWKKGTDA